MCSIDCIEVQLLLRKVQPFLRNKEDSEVALHASEVRQSRSEVTTLLSVKCLQANSSGKFLFQKLKRMLKERNKLRKLLYHFFAFGFMSLLVGEVSSAIF